MAHYILAILATMYKQLETSQKKLKVVQILLQD